MGCDSGSAPRKILQMKMITPALAAELLEKAAVAPRRRTHFNLHDSTDEPINRLAVAVLPESRFPAHRHSGKWELFTILQGKMALFLYDDAGNIIGRHTLGEDVYTVEIPAGVWHNYVALAPSLALEVKAGPYEPLSPEDSAPFPGMMPEDLA